MMYSKLTWSCAVVVALAAGGVLAGCFGTGAGGGPAAPRTTQTRTFAFRIGRAGNTGLSEGEADAILSRATAVLRGKDASDDVPADVILARSGAITNVAGPAIIDSKADFDQLGHTGKDVIVVEAINYCGGFSPNIVGCAPIGGSYMAVVRQSEVEEILWAHEFGHNRGLNHRGDPGAIMYPQLGYTRLSLTRFEAEIYQGRAVGAGGGGAAPAHGMNGMDGMEAGGHGGGDGVPPATLEEFLGRVYVHGIPYAHAAVFGPEQVPALRGVLANPSRKAVWANAAVALSTVGTPEALEAVRAFVAGGSSARAGSVYQAKRAAVMSLGYAVQKAVRQERPAQRDAALAQLREYSASGFAVQQGPVQAPSPAEPGAVGAKTAALAGLALSGTAEARQTLARVASEPSAEPRRAAFAQKALGELQKVQAVGIRQYTQQAHGAE